MGAHAVLVATRVVVLLATYEQRHGGWLFTDGMTYQCFPFDPNRVRKPDASYIAPGRFENDVLPEGHIRIPPDLAVEVVSPNDLYIELEKKVDDYLRAGVRMVWVVSPEFRTVRVFRDSIEHPTQFGPQDELSGEDVLPGFRCRVLEFFGKPPSSNNA